MRTPSEQFYNELSLFCEDQEWTCIDVEMMRGVSNSSDCFTFVSEAHGSQRWLDHCIVSKAAVPSVRRVFVKYDVLWSDHFPLILECNLGIVSPKILECKSTVNEVIWGERSVDQVGQYMTECHRHLRLLDFPEEFIKCADYTCNILQHRRVIDSLYNNIVKILKDAALCSKRSNVYLRKKKKPVVGWNLHVSEAHREARRTFDLWCSYGKPNSGAIFSGMYEARKIFKNRLRWCQNHQDQVKMDILASHHSKNDFRSFWKATNKLNNKPFTPVCIDGVSDPSEIADLFRQHFTVKSPLGSSQSMINVKNGEKLGFRCTTRDVQLIIGSMTRGKSPGHDGLSIEHLQHAGPHLPRLLSMLFNLCLSHSYLPEEMIKTIVIPIVKNKTADLSDRNNYRPISLATVVSKVFDSMLNSQLTKHIELHDNQFGFRSGLSTESAVLCVKHAVKYYTKRQTAVHACFLDLSKAFDLVSYDILWKKLQNTSLPVELINICKYWYGNQVNGVRWSESMSQMYKVGVRGEAGGIVLSNPVQPVYERSDCST